MLWIEEEQEARVLQLTECDEKTLEGFPPVAPIPQALPDSDRTTFDRFMEHLEEGTAEKLVLAHRVELPSIATAQVVAAFDKALTHYPHAFVSLCYTPQSGLWLCATPVSYTHLPLSWSESIPVYLPAVDPAGGKASRWHFSAHPVPSSYIPA